MKNWDTASTGEAEHHNTKAFASSATVLLIEHVLASTGSIRVGAGGIMLLNHSPYIVAEQFSTLETLCPEQVDLRLGRVAGLDVPFYIPGSSTDSACLAAELGLPYAFASHFAPASLEKAVAIYRQNFQPGKYLAYPYVLIASM